MTQEFTLNQKKVTILTVLVLVLVLLVFIAGYLSGTLVGLPETKEQSAILEPAVKPQPQPQVVTRPVPQVAKTPEPEEVEEIDGLKEDVAELEPEEEIAEPEPEKAVPAESLYSVQVGAFRTETRAKDHEQLLVDKGYHPYIYHGANSRGVLWYTLRIGDFDELDAAITAAREFRALERSTVVLTHFNSLMMVRDDDGKRIEIAPPERATPVEAAVEVTPDQPALIPDEPAPVTGEPEPETVADESEAVAAELEVAAEEPEIIADANVSEIETAEGQSTETTVAEVAGPAKHRVTFSLPEEPPPVPAATSSVESVGGLIAASEAKHYAVQVGAFLNGENAVKFAEKLRGRDYPAYVFRYTDTVGRAWSAVRTGDFEDLGTAKVAAAEFEAKEGITAIVTKINAIKMILK
ncbi:MAG: SPOR domain-containing protein [Desulfobacterales bacterium]|nr:SPOR domain-containing protein [Desulfobacterales bacterium]